MTDTIRARWTRDNRLVTIERYRGSGYYQVTKFTEDDYIDRRLFDTARDAWRYYRHNRLEVN